MSKTLILYYSYEGSTKKLAEDLAQAIGADLERITPVKEMTAKGFTKFLWGGSQVVMKKKPPINPLKSSLEDYDTILVGSPIWADTYAPPILTLFESGQIKNKNVGYFYGCFGGDQKVAEKAKALMGKENVYLSTCGCKNVSKNYDSAKAKVIDWAKNL